MGWWLTMHARLHANGFIEAIAGLAIASGKFDCINHRYYKGASCPYSIYVLKKPFIALHSLSNMCRFLWCVHFYYAYALLFCMP